MSVRQRNLAFLTVIGDALQLDKLTTPDWASTKAMITPAAVRKINEGIVRLWPPDTNVERTLSRSDGKQTAFYSGDYRPDRLLDAVGRHLVYADAVSLGDPFIYPLSMRDEYSPLLHPEKHLTNTARSVHVWLALFPLITQGLVELIRLPADFDVGLNKQNHTAMEDLHQRNPDLRKIVEKFSKARARDNDESKEWFMLLQPDDHLRQIIRTQDPDVDPEHIEATIRHIQQRRKEHPFFMRAGDEMVAETFGSSAYDCMQVAQITGSYLITDLKPRWRQFEVMKREVGEVVDEQMRVAHSLGNLSVPMSSHFNLDLAKRIRAEGQLERVRGLLDKLMRNAGSDNPLSEQEARSFQHELRDAIAEARDEYAAIDRSLISWAGAEAIGAAGLVTMTSTALSVSLGAAVLAGAANLVASTWARRTFKDRFPAGMFMDVPIK